MPILDKPDLLDAPIPGQALTGEPGAYPWEQPPQLTTVDEAVEHYIPMFNEEEILSGVLSHIEGGVALATMADLITKGGVMTGLHSIDVGIMVAPVLVEMMITAADAADIEYTIGTEPKEKKGSTKVSIAAALRDKEVQEEPLPTELGQVMEMSMDEPVEEPVEEESMGMMSRRGV
jgi:hypothetical protein|tara:strand:+ start:591 stop:1118 length:528 start_codon:yes stop_codon:yes gene_type:complete